MGEKTENRWPVLRVGHPLLILTLGSLCLLTACHTADPTPRLQRFHYSSPQMGTTFGITVYAESKAQARESAQAAFSRIAALEDILSDYLADSELKQLTENDAGQPVPVGNDLFMVLHRGAQLSAITDGAFDLTVGPYTRLWRFSRKQGVLPSPEELATARARVGWEKLILNTNDQTVTLSTHGLRLDAGGMAKGYAADEAMMVLKDRGIDRALIAAGGDILTSQPPPGEPGWRVCIGEPDSDGAGQRVSGWVGYGGGVGAPSGSGSAQVGLSFGGRTQAKDRSRSVRVVSVRNAALSTSGDRTQFVEIEGVHYSHIVSPFTGLGLTNRIQATVIAPDAATADALATACCVLGRDRALPLVDSIPQVSVILTTREDDRTAVWRSNGAP